MFQLGVLDGGKDLAETGAGVITGSNKIVAGD
jgi:hypothetical protein